ncbi:glycoside hydrolase family 16 protein [Acidocella sp. KAb 2-4]|uniref:glycoside hydrolase family 16 protein n=1 Tax=Acidocella sp. KAb 2-4 TaxID=2885158 RepID=UPI001D05DD1B|nr:glycoside hydrolase family 16 protein [Acidocella sp. KAb 2-4]MCB5944512.1 glycoside hydrolase family 16 protein [Acidocella sp. KAb 2-4]
MPPPQQMDLSGYHATFSDDFSSLSLNAQGAGARWITHTPWHGDFGDAIFADPSSGVFKSSPDGLEIIASKGTDGKWRSGLICSAWADNNPTAGFTQKYGYFEMTAKLPDGMGTWPAFWLIGSDKRTAAAEIDVVEYYGGFPRYFHTTEHVWVNGRNKYLRAFESEVPSGQLSAGFNQFGVLITPQTTSFYLNRREFWSTPTPPEYQQPMYILADLALGGGWPIAGLKSPIVMRIRDITVWQRDKPWD